MSFRGPNVSQFIARLNAINPSQSSPETQDDYSAEDDLNLFATTQFFDFDLAEQPGTSQTGSKESDKAEREELDSMLTDPLTADPMLSFTGDWKNLEFPEGTDFSGTDFSAFDATYSNMQPVIPNEQLFQPLLFSDALNTLPLAPSLEKPTSSLATEQALRQPRTANSQRHQPILPALNISTQAPVAEQRAVSTDWESTPMTPTTPASPMSPSSPSLSSSKKDKPATEDARQAAEEDKRRRNTAASARFRVKKKAKEQALEQKAKKLENINSELEARIRQLETENKWMRNLLTQRDANTTVSPGTTAEPKTAVSKKAPKVEA